MVKYTNGQQFRLTTTEQVRFGIPSKNQILTVFNMTFNTFAAVTTDSCRFTKFLLFDFHGVYLKFDPFLLI